MRATNDRNAVLRSVTLPRTCARYEGFNEAICTPCPTIWTRSAAKNRRRVWRQAGAAETPTGVLRKFTRLVSASRWQADQDLADCWRQPVEFRVKNFRAICGARIVRKRSTRSTFEFDENTSILKSGQRAYHAGRISSTATYHGHVREIDTRRVRISIPLKNPVGIAVSGQDWDDRPLSERRHGEATTPRCTIFWFPMDERRRRFLGEGLNGNWALTPFQSVANLNRSQAEAIHREVVAGVPPHPGTPDRQDEGHSGDCRAHFRSRALGAFTNTA